MKIKSTLKKTYWEIRKSNESFECLLIPINHFRFKAFNHPFKNNKKMQNHFWLAGHAKVEKKNTEMWDREGEKEEKG